MRHSIRQARTFTAILRAGQIALAASTLLALPGYATAQVGAGDMDGDGIPDVYDGDRDGDGISNRTEDACGGNSNDPNVLPPDQDGDGIPDAYDGSDTDGDGQSDAEEFRAGTDPGDPNQTPPAAPDQDGDGIPDQFDGDRDGDGESDDSEQRNGGNPNDPNVKSPDADGDTLPDAVDGSDTDGDGASDSAEHLAGTDPTDPNDTPPAAPDQDGDGIADVYDGDRDGDGEPDRIEQRYGGNPNDPNVKSPDANGNGLPNAVDGMDSDGDGWTDAEEHRMGSDASNPFSTPQPFLPFDQDGDGIADVYDTDRDGDGESDRSERLYGGNPNDPNVKSPDADNDGLPDAIDGSDTDGDGASDSHEHRAGTDPTNPNQTPAQCADQDGDGIADVYDGDRDGDGESNESEERNGGNPDDPNVKSPDADGDTLPDAVDGSDTDGDGQSDAHEHRNGTDPNDPGSVTQAAQDLDQDGLPDVFDENDDDDSWSDAEEVEYGGNPTDALAGCPDANLNGIPDALEPLDTDGDGQSDSYEHLLGNDPLGGLFTAYGFGDGSSGPCPCGNQVPVASGGCANSTGQGAHLSAAGSSSLSQGQLELIVRRGVPHHAGVVFQGTQAVNLPASPAVGNGLLCVAGQTRRLEIVLFDSMGEARTQGPLQLLGNVEPGQTLYYQTWYRDPGAPGCTGGSNLSSAVAVEWGL